MSTWWQVNNWRAGIISVEVVKETEKMLEYVHPYFKKPQRVKKGKEFFPTFAAARTQLLEHFNRKMEEAKIDRDRAKGEWEKVFLMEPPKDTQ